MTTNPALPTGAPVRYEVSEQGIATIALDDPARRNALSGAMLDALLAAFAAARDDTAVRCVVLRSTHEKVFSAGGDLAAFAGDVPSIVKHDENAKFVRLFQLIRELGKPVVCAAGGHVIAGAVGLALACDLVVAADSSTFSTPEITIGLFPFMIMALIYRNIGQKKATELLLLGERVSAAEAERLGLVNKVVAPEQLDEAVEEWARKLASRSPLLMRLGRQAMAQQADLPLGSALELLRHNLTLALSTEDLREGVAAFFEKREPQWKGV